MQKSPTLFPELCSTGGANFGDNRKKTAASNHHANRATPVAAAVAVFAHVTCATPLLQLLDPVSCPSDAFDLPEGHADGNLEVPLYA